MPPTPAWRSLCFRPGSERVATGTEENRGRLTVPPSGPAATRSVAGESLHPLAEGGKPVPLVFDLSLRHLTCPFGLKTKPARGRLQWGPSSDDPGSSGWAFQTTASL